MMKSFQLVVFDWEGTIADTLGHILHVVSEEAQRLGLHAVDPYEARDYVSLGLAHALKKLYPDLSLNQYETLHQAIQEALIHKATEISLLPGARDFINRLQEQGYYLAIATNKGHASLLKALQVTGLEQIFTVTRSAGQVPAKPCPQMLQELLDEFGLQPEDAVMIGDSMSDMEMAVSLGVRAIGVDFYHQYETALKSAGAEMVFDDYRALSDYLFSN